MHWFVSALAAEWIEIRYVTGTLIGISVSALAAEWIEIGKNPYAHLSGYVSALAAEWIEIGTAKELADAVAVSALAAEWIEISCLLRELFRTQSPPSRRSGLKSPTQMTMFYRVSLRPRGGVD